MRIIASVFQKQLHKVVLFYLENNTCLYISGKWQMVNGLAHLQGHTRLIYIYCIYIVCITCTYCISTADVLRVHLVYASYCYFMFVYYIIFPLFFFLQWRQYSTQHRPLQTWTPISTHSPMCSAATSLRWEMYTHTHTHTHKHTNTHFHHFTFCIPESSVQARY